MDLMPMPTLSPSDLALHHAHALRLTASRAEVAAMEFALEFCDLNSPDAGGGTPAAMLDYVRDIPLGGEGVPLVAESAVAEFAAAMSMSPSATRAYLSDTLELAHRLPRIWERLLAGDLPAFRARRIAAHTIRLSPEAVAYFDATYAATAERLGPIKVARIVDEVTELVEPHAIDVDTRRVYAGLPESDGTVEVVARVDHADALDLERALQTVAAELAGSGDESSLDVRRSKALGEIARRALGISGLRPVQLYVHLDPALTRAGVESSAVSHKLDQIAAWTRGASVRITPILDLAVPQQRPGYVPSERMREQAVLANGTCVFPECNRSARACDLDHVVAWGAGGETSSDNLAPLCRTHHRLKTHAGWHYRRTGPASYHWTSPLGRTYDVVRT